MKHLRATMGWLATQTYVETTEVLLLLSLVAIVYGLGGLWGRHVASLVGGVIVLVYAWPPRTMPMVADPDRKVG